MANFAGRSAGRKPRSATAFSSDRWPGFCSKARALACFLEKRRQFRAWPSSGLRNNSEPIRAGLNCDTQLNAAGALHLTFGANEASRPYLAGSMGWPRRLAAARLTRPLCAKLPPRSDDSFTSLQHRAPFSGVCGLCAATQLASPQPVRANAKDAAINLPATSRLLRQPVVLRGQPANGIIMPTAIRLA